MSFYWSWFIVLSAWRNIFSLSYKFVSHLFYSVYAQKEKEKRIKKEKRKNIYINKGNMYSVSIFLGYVYGFMRIIVLNICITYGSSYLNFSRSQYLVLEYVIDL